MKPFLHYSAMLIGGYLVVYYYTGAGTVINSAGTASSGLVRAFQGR